MKLPIILIIDDDPQVLRAIRRDVRKNYKTSYRVMATESANEALESLEQLKKEGQNVALFLSDQRMPEMLGVEFLEKAKVFYPEAKRVILTAYSDIDAAIKAINDVQLDYYLTKPWDPPEEKLYPILDDLLDDWSATVIPDFDGLKILGYQFSPKSHKIKDYLSGNLIPYKWIDFEADHSKAQELMSLYELEEKDLPAVIFEDGSTLSNPDIADIAPKIGRNTSASEELYDVAIIGAGPSGLAAAVYGGSEGLKTVLIERRAPGGQAGTSSRIENYLGFPNGLSGSDLARRAITQAEKFGIEFISPAEVVGIKNEGSHKVISLSDGQTIYAKAIVIATGVDYRRLPATGVDDFTGAGIYYGAATTEANACKHKDVFIVGGGNSAGQGAMYLSRFAKNVHILIRKPDLSATMSQYLIDQIESTPNIHVWGRHQVKEVFGKEGHLSSLSVENMEEGGCQEYEAGALFIFIGAKPYTDWVQLDLLRNPKGYVITGKDLLSEQNFDKVWKLKRNPYFLETCVPGIFASGDVRSGAMNRVASAVGEGSMAISFVHKYLAEI
ncbi:MAG: FAD-dependent oxidoreductase [Bacteroidia bacterium]|nr:FAD-dependent oxidoreductase [Bacteroidia bacterium]